MENNIESKLTKFFEQYKSLYFEKGETIYRPGEKIDQVGFVKSGYVRLYSHSKDGKEITLNFFKPVFYLSYLFSSTNKENKYYFEATTEVEMWKSPVDAFQKFVAENQDILFWLNQRLLMALEEVLSNVEDTISGDSYSKIISIIVSLARKISTVEGKETTIDVNTTHRIVASLAGTSRETASKQLKRMEREGLIVQKNRKIVIMDLEKLIEASGKI